MKINSSLRAADLLPKLQRFWQLSAEKLLLLEQTHDPAKGSPVFTMRGRYSARSWTEWTQGFHYGSLLLQFDATGDPLFLESGRRNTVEKMARHVSHFGVHDHGFNNISTYGNLLRLMNEGRIVENEWERRFYELALKISGAVQARRWTPTNGGGYIYSFNGPHSLFVDTIRTLRSLAIAHKLGHVLMEENDRESSLLDRLKAHAIAAGKHVYCEKPTATNTADALQLHRLAEAAGVKNGVVQDKLWLPGLLKLKLLRDTGFFGQILSVRGEFGYWVFEGDTVASQRPSWNYRKEQGGGIIIDMLCHFRYVLDNLFGDVRAVSCLGATHIGKRWDEKNSPYDCTADDSAYATFELAGGIIAHINASWCVRVRRDDLFVLQVDGTKGSAVAGLRHCWVQPYAATPRPTWNPDVETPLSYFDGWQQLPERQTYDNAFKIQWELFLRHVVKDEPFRWTLFEGAKGVQLAEKGIESWQQRQWIAIPDLEE